MKLTMRVGLFIPCYIDQFYPQVAIATLSLLEKLGLDVTYPLQQTCCGQPLANSGYAHLTQPIDQHFTEHFSGFDYIVSPSGSCVLHIKEHLNANSEKAEHIKTNCYELVEFLTDILKVKDFDAYFPFKVGVHQSCHGQRGLRLSSMTELNETHFSKPEKLLSKVKGLELVNLKRNDECCGFGGTFCIAEEAVSIKMGNDRITDHIENGAEFITSADMSCLMHLEGLLKRNKSKVRVVHIAEILNTTKLCL